MTLACGGGDEQGGGYEQRKVRGSVVAWENLRDDLFIWRHRTGDALHLGYRCKLVMYNVF